MAPPTIGTFFLVNTFTDRADGGNPAAIVFLDENHRLDTAAFQAIAANFNQPITTFVTLPVTPSTVGTFQVRWFTPEVETPLCGHGTIAASHAIFAAGTDIVAPGVEILQFVTTSGKTLTSRKMSDGSIQIVLPAAPVAEIPAGEVKDRLLDLYARAVGEDPSKIKFIGKPIEGYERYVLVELEMNMELGDRIVDFNLLRESEFSVSVLTSAAPAGSTAAFVSRMFAPQSGINEDHVCGTAHCLSTPYWTQKHALSPGKEMQARQVSKRGGDLVVSWGQEERVVKLQGICKTVAQGVYNLS